MRNTFLLLLVLTILSILAFILKWDNSENRISGITADRGFAVKDMKKVNKIVVKHVKLQPLVFSREGAGWKINYKYDVDPAVFIHIERVLTNISLLYVPPTNSTATILNSIKNNGIQVDVYEGNILPSKIKCPPIR